VKLSENLGKQNTLVLFFPLAFTGVCTEMCDITSGLSAYSGMNAGSSRSASTSHSPGGMGPEGEDRHQAGL
jgi:peroxiredoxin